MVDATGLVTSWNVGCERLIGYSEDELTPFCSASVPPLVARIQQEPAAPCSRTRLEAPAGRLKEGRQCHAIAGESARLSVREVQLGLRVAQVG